MSLRQSLRTRRRSIERGAHRACRTGIEQLEARLVLTWAGVPPSLIAPPASPVSVSLNSQNDATGTALISGTEVDYYSFTAAVSGTYAISATTPSSSLDTVLGLFSSGGQRLAYNDDIGGGNLDSRITVNLTAGTRYLVGITNYSSFTRGAYTWLIDGPAGAATPIADDPYENNDSLATAYNLGTLASTSTLSNLVMADSDDWFQFTTTATGTSASSVSIAFQNAQGNLNLALYDSAGSLLGSSQGVGNSETISLNGLAAGRYFVRVYGNGGATNPSYSLTIAPPVASTTPVTTFPSVAYYGGSNQWDLNAINAPEAWAQGYRGQGVVVAVVDTGVDLDHSDLTNEIWVNPGEIPGNGIDDDHNGYTDDVHGWDFVGNDSNPDDGNGHGTHVAGTIAAADNGVGQTGVAPDAEIMPVRVLDSNGSGTAAAVAAGIRYAAQNGADIINLSLGGAFSSVIQTAISYAQSLNVLVVVAAGNESASTPSYPARFSATMSNVISVGAHNSSNALAGFSNDVGSSGAVQVDAPGVGVYSTYLNGTYATLSGTSMATPHVAGLAALALSANHALSASQLRTLIVNGANRPISGSDSRGGINAAVTVALAAAGQTSAVATSATTSSASLQFANLNFATFFSRASAGSNGAAAADLSAAVATSRAISNAVANAASTTELAPQAVDRAILSLYETDAVDSLASVDDDGADESLTPDFCDDLGDADLAFDRWDEAEQELAVA